MTLVKSERGLRLRNNLRSWANLDRVPEHGVTAVGHAFAGESRTCQLAIAERFVGVRYARS